MTKTQDQKKADDVRLREGEAHAAIRLGDVISKLPGGTQYTSANDMVSAFNLVNAFTELRAIMQAHKLRMPTISDTRLEESDLDYLRRCVSLKWIEELNLLSTKLREKLQWSKGKFSKTKKPTLEQIVALRGLLVKYKIEVWKYDNVKNARDKIDAKK